MLQHIYNKSEIFLKKEIIFVFYENFSFII